VLEAAVRTSRVLVTIIDPYTFESEWVVKENAWAEQYGRPIITLYDGAPLAMHRASFYPTRPYPHPC